MRFQSLTLPSPIWRASAISSSSSKTRISSPAATQRLAARTAKQVGCSYAIRIGRPNRTTGYVALPGGGPILTCRAVNDEGFPPLPNWSMSLGDIELF